MTGDKPELGWLTVTTDFVLKNDGSADPRRLGQRRILGRIPFEHREILSLPQNHQQSY